jgi:choline dehydrogenase/4-pyridoxate dehydrogenase
MQPDPGLDSRGIECARGKVIGGSSSINVMVYVRGHRADFDRWRESGLAGWSYRDVLPYFKRSESWEGGEDDYRGGSGPLKVRLSRYRDPILGAFIAAGRRAGHPVTHDYNAAEQEGFGYIQQTIDRGRRCSAAVAYLHPVRSRRNLRIVVNALTARIIFEGDRAVGVRYRKDGREHVARARQEVIVCSGVIDSPKLLMLSGIGDPAHLAAHGIDVQCPSPGVGENFQDHLSAIVVNRRRDRGTMTEMLRYDRIATAVTTAWLGGESFASDVPTGVTAFLKSVPDRTVPDLQLIFLASPFPARPWLPPFTAPVPDTFGCRVVLLRPESRGRVELASADPAAPPRIIPQFLSAEADRDALRRGVRLVREIMAQRDLAPHSVSELAPGADCTSDDALDAFIRKSSVTVHHPAGTCRMGAASDAKRVVDAELRVCGVEGLRVVDASVMPDLVGGNINGVVIMIAEKASDMILGRAPLPALEPAAADVAAACP